MSIEPKKVSVLRVLDILKEYSDYNHPLTQDDIIKKLDSLYDIQLERKAVGRDLKLLEEVGYDIGSTKKKGVYLITRDFEDSELRMLIDGVLTSRYVSTRDSTDLIDRLCKLSNKYFRTHVNHIHTVDDWNKTDNRSLFYNIEVIDEAIETGKQIWYEYNKYNKSKNLEKSSQQLVSPYQMILHNQRYYLMAYSEYWHNMCYHRLDHITKIKIVDAHATPLNSIPEFKKGIDYKRFSSSMPYMYTDTPTRVEFIADIEILDQVIDWFGKDITITSLPDPNKLKITLKVSPLAMELWACQYLKHVEVIYPESLRNSIKKVLQDGVDKYK